MWTWIAYIIVFAGIYTILLNWEIRKLFKGTPGPVVIPVLGNFHNLDDFYPESFSRLSRKYGPVFRIMFGGTPCAVVSDPELLREAFVRKYAKYSNRPFTETIKRIYIDTDPTYSGIGFAQYGKQFTHKKQILMQKLLKKSLVQRAQDDVDKETNIIIQHMKSNNEFVVRDLMNQITFNVITLLSMSQRICDTPDDTMQKLKVIGDAIMIALGTPMIGDYIPWMQIFERSKRTELDRVIKERNEIMQYIVDERKKTLDPSNPKDILDELLLDGNDDKTMIMILIEIFIAGSDTTSVLLTWSIYTLSEYPEVQEKLYQDVMKGSDDCPYLEAFLCEAHRRFAVGPTFIPHVLAEDDTLGSYFLPKGTMIFANWWGIAHDASLWQDPYEFRPERWLGLTESQRTEIHKKFFPFSIGPRQCPGMNLAEMEARRALKGLVREFKFSWSGSSKKLSFQERWEPIIGLVAAPARSRALTCIAEPRNT